MLTLSRHLKASENEQRKELNTNPKECKYHGIHGFTRLRLLEIDTNRNAFAISIKNRTHRLTTAQQIKESLATENEKVHNKQGK